jgi:5,10-methylenetetrahydromethanopterin reductase
MRHGIAFIPAMSIRRTVDLARQAEEQGYDVLFIPDQTFHRDPFVVLALCAESTTRIHLGLAVTNPYTRHPVQIARAAGVLAEISDNRFSLGLGAGNLPRVLHGFGMPQVGVIERLRESVDIIRRLLAGETVTHDSPTLTLNEVALDFQVPHRVPIYIGTRGPKLLALAGEIADGVMMEGLFTPGGLSWALDRVAEGAARAGRSLDDVDVVAWQAVEIVDSSAEVEADRFRRWAALLIRTTAPDVLREVGVSQAAIDSVDAELAAGEQDPPGASIPADDIAKLIMVGTTEQIAEQLRALLSTPVNCVAGVVLGDEGRIAMTIASYARQVRKQLERGLG